MKNNEDDIHFFKISLNYVLLTSNYLNIHIK